MKSSPASTDVSELLDMDVVGFEALEAEAQASRIPQDIKPSTAEGTPR